MKQAFKVFKGDDMFMLPPQCPLQFFDRVRLFGMPAKHQPDFIYLRHVPLRKVHLFTIIQLSCLIMLWVIKTSKAAIVFPMMVRKQSSSAIRGTVGLSLNTRGVH